jgi:hypothetical protein
MKFCPYIENCCKPNRILINLPFVHFKFYDQEFHLSELEEFFQKWGKNVKSIDWRCIVVCEGNFNTRVKSVDLNPWLDLCCSSLRELNIRNFKSPQMVKLNLAKLIFLRVIYLSACVLELKSEDFVNKISPEKITVNGCKFCNENNEKLEEVALNEFIDFSSCFNISISTPLFEPCIYKFDLLTNLTKLNKLRLAGRYLQISGWERCVEKLKNLKCLDIEN